jgi:hypothetical protein
MSYPCLFKCVWASFTFACMFYRSIFACDKVWCLWPHIPKGREVLCHTKELNVFGEHAAAWKWCVFFKEIISLKFDLGEIPVLRIQTGFRPDTDPVLRTEQIRTHLNEMHQPICSISGVLYFYTTIFLIFFLKSGWYRSSCYIPAAGSLFIYNMFGYIDGNA